MIHANKREEEVWRMYGLFFFFYAYEGIMKDEDEKLASSPCQFIGKATKT